MKVRKISIIKKLIIFVLALFLISDVILAVVIYNKSNDVLNREIRKNTEGIAKSTAALIDGEIVASVQPGDEGTEDYIKVSQFLKKILDATGVEYLYTVRYTADKKLEYAIESQVEDFSAIGDEFDDEEVIPALEGKVVSSEEPYTDEWGEHITSYSPIYVDGKVVGAVGADVSMEWIREQTTAMVKDIVITCLLVLIVGGIVFVLLSKALSSKFNMLNDKIVELTNKIYEKQSK